MTGEPECVFCRIVAGELPCFKLYEDEHALAFMDINPAHDGHALAVSKEHAPTVFDISDQALAATVIVARRVAEAVRKTMNPAGINLVQSNGDAAGQSVLHFHIHILPRAAGDALDMNWALTPGDMDAIGKLAERIRAHI